MLFITITSSFFLFSFYLQFYVFTILKQIQTLVWKTTLTLSLSTVFLDNVDKINVHNYGSGKKNNEFILFISLAMRDLQSKTLSY